MTVFDVPVRTMNEANHREHWRGRQGRAKAQRQAVAFLFRAHCRAWVGWYRKRPDSEARFVVTLTRISPGELDAHDGLQAALKACVDAVAEELGLAQDRDDRVAWKHAQQRGPRGVYAVRISIEEK